MEAEDTVMGEDRKDQLINMATRLTDPMPILEVMKFGDAVADEQAEISFKAGIREGMSQKGICYDCEALNELLRQKTGMGQGEIDSEAEDIKQAQLKEWGIK